MTWDLYNAEKTTGDQYCQRFLLWPDKWKQFRWATRLQWESVSATKAGVKALPTSPGVYAFLICPKIAQLADHGIVAYIGETKGTTQNLRKRCAVYFRESEYKARPHIGDLMKRWRGYIKLYFAKAPADKVPELEERLLLAFTPPFNRKFPGTFNKVAASIYRQ